MAPTIFFTLLVLVSLYAFWRGHSDERLVAGICLLGALASLLLLSPIDNRFHHVEMGVMLVDVAVLVGFVGVALRSPRFWPLWVAGLQLTTTMGHLLKSIDTDLFPKAYGAALQIWSYPILLLLFIGTWRAGRTVDGDYEHQNPSLG